MAARARVMTAPVAYIKQAHFAKGGSGEDMESQIRQVTFACLIPL